MVQQHNLQALAERLTQIEEILHNFNMTNNIVEEATSYANAASELRKDLEEVQNSPSRHNTCIVLPLLTLKEEKTSTFLLKFLL